MAMVFHRIRTTLASILVLATVAVSPAPARTTARAQQADFAGATASAQAHEIADWTIATGDNHDLPFLIVDKIAARLFLFDRRGTLQAATAVLLGGAQGDVSPPGVGDKPLATIAPAERITPAGRFIADRGVNLAGRDIVWIDYAAAIAIHRVTDVKPGATTRDRLKRLAGAVPRARRVSLGCINVTDAFYDAYLRPAFAASSGIVYILPEASPLAAVFAIPRPITPRS